MDFGAVSWMHSVGRRKLCWQEMTEELTRFLFCKIFLIIREGAWLSIVLDLNLHRARDQDNFRAVHVLNRGQSLLAR